MSREFELNKEVELEGTPEQVWDAIATGPGISSWFMGPHEVEPYEGGQMRLVLGDFTEQSTITTWDPPKHLAYRTAPAPDGTFHAMEYLIEGRDNGSTVLRFVHSGFLSDDWGPEYEDMTDHGWTMYFHTLGQYLKYFTGRPGTYVYAPTPEAPEGTDAWTVLIEKLGLTEPIAQGDHVVLRPEGLAPIEGVVDYARPEFREFLGVRGTDGLYRFHGGGPQIGIGHHIFSAEPQDWQSWASRLYA